MEIHVYFISVNDGSVDGMCFDVLIPVKDDQKAISCAKEYLKSINKSDATLKKHKYCHHIEPTPEESASIDKQGYHILPMVGCP